MTGVGRPLGNATTRSGAKERLLDAALLEFARAGYAGASIRGITRLLGMRASGFYAHFPSKQAAYDELFQEGGPAVVTHWASRISTDEGPRAALTALAATIMEAWSAPRARMLASVVLREVFAGQSDKRDSLLAGIAQAKEQLGSLFATWQQQGAMRRGVQPEILAFEFLAPLVMLRILHYNQASSASDLLQGDVLVGQHVEAFLHLALAKPE